LLLAVAAALLAAAAAQLRDKSQAAQLAIESIHEQLDALDPVTRAAVVARLSSELVREVRAATANDLGQPHGQASAARSPASRGQGHHLAVNDPDAK
jgi:hypothetical protein